MVRPPVSQDEKQPDGTRKHVKTCEVFRNVVSNDSRLPEWVTNGIGCVESDTRAQTRCKRLCKAMMRNLSHATTQQFLRRLGHCTRKLPPVGGTWEAYDKLRKQVVPDALTPDYNNLKTIATVLGVWREKEKNPVAGEPGTWGHPSAPGIVNKMRVTNRRRGRNRWRPY